MVRTRVAVSPTGYPHIGTIYQALFDYAYAKRNKGKFIVRIEDTDRERFVSDSEEKLYTYLDWFGLSEDESPRKGGSYEPYVQSKRLLIYQKYVQQLIDNGYAYYCFCSKERLEKVRHEQQKEKKPLMYDKHCRSLSQEIITRNLSENKAKVIRLKVPENTKIITHDEIRGDIEFDSSLIDDQVLLKSDGYPTYHLAVVIDDHQMEITDVVRGEEWISSFPKHKLLYDYFSWKMPKFYHTSALRNPDHTKLSKRQGHTNISWYQDEGYLPEAIINYISLLGWSHPKGEEVFSIEEFISLFDLKDIKPIGPVFDLRKLLWMNGVYIRNLGIKELSEKLLAFNSNYKKMDKEQFEKIVTLAQTRIQTLKDFEMLVKHFYEFTPTRLDIGQQTIAKDLAQQLTALPKWNSEDILEIMRVILREYTIKMPVLYILFTGEKSGLPLPETLTLLGKEKTIQRLHNRE